MPGESSSEFDQIQPVIDEIRAKAALIQPLTSRLRILVNNMERSLPKAVSERSAEYWRVVFLVNSLVRISLFLEQNFYFIETMGLLAVTRYVFELTVWLKRMQGDVRYGLVCYYQLLKQQRDFHGNLMRHSELEISYLRDFASAEETMLQEAIAVANEIPQEKERQVALRQVATKVAATIDEDASRKFSIYADQAKHNGYSFQAYLVENKVIPRCKGAVDDIDREFRDFESRLTGDVKALAKKGWNWRQQALEVGMGEEYEFIYAYTSVLMHATPASIISDEKNIELGEVRMFLKYICVRVNDAINIAQECLAWRGISSNHQIPRFWLPNQLCEDHGVGGFRQS